MNEITEILSDNYYTLASTGLDAACACADDLAMGRFAPNIAEWGISERDFADLASEFIVWCLAPERRHTPAVSV